MDEVRHKHGGDVFSNKNCIDFSANINPLGMSEYVRKSILESVDSCERYPDTKCRGLRKALSVHEKFSAENIICTNGAAELIFAICFSYKPKKALLTAPSFGEYAEALTACGCDIEYYYLDENNDFAAGYDFIEKIGYGTDIVFFTNPNNPVGNSYDYQFIKSLYEKCRENKTLLAVDECFLDFIDRGNDISAKRLLNEYDNTIIIKALTKFYAVPGLRIGYGLCKNSAMLSRISLCLQAWNVSSLAQTAGEHCFDDKNFENKTIKYIKEEKIYLLRELKNLGVKVYGSSANYIFFKEDENFSKDMLKLGILVRDCRNYEGLSAGFYRIAVRRHDENTKLVEVWRKRKKG